MRLRSELAGSKIGLKFVETTAKRGWGRSRRGPDDTVWSWFRDRSASAGCGDGGGLRHRFTCNSCAFPQREDSAVSPRGKRLASLSRILHIFTCVWRFGVAVTRWSRSCSTSSPVSTGMGDCLRAGKLSHYGNQPPRPTQPFILLG